MGVVLDVVPDDELASTALALAQRLALVPSTSSSDHAGAGASPSPYDPPKRHGCSARSSDGVARHSQEGDFVTRSMEVGFRERYASPDPPPVRRATASARSP